MYHVGKLERDDCDDSRDNSSINYKAGIDGLSLVSLFSELPTGSSRTEDGNHVISFMQQAEVSETTAQTKHTLQVNTLIFSFY